MLKIKGLLEFWTSRLSSWLEWWTLLTRNAKQKYMKWSSRLSVEMWLLYCGKLAQHFLELRLCIATVLQIYRPAVLYCLGNIWKHHSRGATTIPFFLSILALVSEGRYHQSTVVRSSEHWWNRDLDGGLLSCNATVQPKCTLYPVGWGTPVGLYKLYNFFSLTSIQSFVLTGATETSSSLKKITAVLWNSF